MNSEAELIVKSYCNVQFYSIPNIDDTMNRIKQNIVLSKNKPRINIYQVKIRLKTTTHQQY